MTPSKCLLHILQKLHISSVSPNIREKKELDEPETILHLIMILSFLDFL